MADRYTYDVEYDYDEGCVSVTRWEKPGKPPGWAQLAGEHSIDVHALFDLLAARGES